MLLAALIASLHRRGNEEHHIRMGEECKMSFQMSFFFSQAVISEESSQTECAGVPQCVRHRSTALLTIASVLS